MPQPTAYYAGTDTPIPEHELPAAVARGQAEYDAGARVHVKLADGSIGTVPAEQLGQAMAGGAGVLASTAVAQREQAAADEAHAAQFRTPGQVYLTQLEATARGITGGYSDAALRALGDTNIGEREKANPSFAAAHEISAATGTAIGGALLSGGGSAVGEVGAAGRALEGLTAPARAVGAVGDAAGGIVGGGLRALGYEGATAAGRIGATALRLGATGAAEGAVMGAGQAVSRSALDDSPLTIDKLTAAVQRGALTGGIGGAALGAAGRGALEGYRALGGAEAVQGIAARQAFHAVAADQAKAYTDAGGRVERIGQKMLDSGAMATKLETTAANLERRVTEAGEQMQTVARSLDEAGIRPNAQGILDRVQAQVEKLRGVGLGETNKLAARLEKEIAPMGEQIAAGETPSFTQVWEQRKVLGSLVYEAQRNAKGLRKRAYDELYGSFAQSLDDATAEGAGELQGAWRRAAEDFHDFKTASDAAKEMIKRRSKGRAMGLSDYGAGLGAIGTVIASGGGAIPAMASAAAAGAASKLVRERGSAVAAKALDAVAKFDKRVTAAVEGMSGTVAAKLPRAAPVPVIVAARSRAGEAIPAPDPHKDQAQYWAAVESIQRFQSDPAHAAAMLGPRVDGIAHENPTLAALVMTRLRAQAGMAAARIPGSMSPATSSMTPAAERPHVPRPEQERFMSYLRGLSEPEHTVDQLAAGVVDRDAVDALRDGYPALYADIRQRVALTVAQRTEPLPYARRLLLGTAFQFPADRSLQPDYVASIQMQYAQQDAGGPQQPPPARSNLDPQLGTALYSGSQRAEAQ